MQSLSLFFRQRKSPPRMLAERETRSESGEKVEPKGARREANVANGNF